MKQDIFHGAKKLGFGLMRLPTQDDGTVNLEEVKKMVDAFMEKGFSYFDTAYVYHDGKSESVFKYAVAERYPRDAYTVATKLPGWELKTKEDVDRIFREQLDNLGVEYIDFYLLHAVSEDNVHHYNDNGCWSRIQQFKAEGKIKNIGFSFHGTPELLQSLLTDHPEADFVQLQINYLDWESDRVCSRRCYEIAQSFGVPVIVMEPVKGGTLASMPENAANILKGYAPEKSLASWALRYCASLDGVKMILSGMSDMSQIYDNVSTLFAPNALNEEEYALVNEVTKALLAIKTVPCTACKYCVEGCPMSISIPDLLSCINHFRRYGKTEKSATDYQKFTKEKGLASQCIGCGQCESVCPQHIAIPEALAEAAELFE